MPRAGIAALALRPGARRHQRGDDAVDGDLRRVDPAAHGDRGAPLGGEGARASELALEAARQALDRGRAGSRRTSRLILFATLSPDHIFPGSALLPAAPLGIPGTPRSTSATSAPGSSTASSAADACIRDRHVEGCSWSARRCTPPASTSRPAAATWRSSSATAPARPCRATDEPERRARHASSTRTAATPRTSGCEAPGRAYTRASRRSDRRSASTTRRWRARRSSSTRSCGCPR